LDCRQLGANALALSHFYLYSLICALDCRQLGANTLALSHFKNPREAFSFKNASRPLERTKKHPVKRAGRLFLGLQRSAGALLRDSFELINKYKYNFINRILFFIFAPKPFHSAGLLLKC
jgi:hypothetical protein